MTDKNAIDSVKTSLYAAVGAGDLVVQAVADVVAQVRERAENTQGDVNGRVDGARELASVQGDVAESVEALRERLAGLPSELPEELAELREKFSPEELRKVAEAYLKVAGDLYNSLAERGEDAVERIRKQPAVEEGIAAAESALGDAVELTEDALGTVARQTRAVGEQAAKLAAALPDASPTPQKRSARRSLTPARRSPTQATRLH
ncbi:heparin-binding hemagglutinin [Rhodococcus baikonurensis]